MDIESIFTPGMVVSRRALSFLLDRDDRSCRNMIRDARKRGIPIVPSEGGYKLAESEEEKRELLAMYKGRALDELHTYNALCRALQLEGQISVEEMLEAVE